MPYVRLLCLLALLVAAPPASAAERHTIAIEVNETGAMQVGIAINGAVTVNGVIDTAATYPMIDAASAARAGVPALSPSAPMIGVLGLDGPATYPVIRLASLRAGTVRLGATDCALNTQQLLPGAKFVLPANALVGDVLDFDFPHGRFSVYDGRPDRTPAMLPGRAAITAVDGLWFVDVEINGTSGRALIDTGSPHSFINTRFANAAAVDPNPEKTRLLVGITPGATPLKVATTRAIRVSRHTVSGLDMIVADPELFTHLGLADTPSMVLGLDFLSAFRVQIDRKRSLLLLTAPRRKRGLEIRLNPPNSRIPE
jgi:predicted aspartyl protease